MTKLTENFTLDEFLQSQTAARHDINMDPPPEVVDNLRRLCVDILQPLRDAIGVPIRITSGYRPAELNTRIGGSLTSAHMFGRAADIQVPGRSPLDIAVIIRNMNLPYDQVIHEFGQWVHVGIPDEPDNARMQELTAYRSGGRTHYDIGLRSV